MTADFNAHASSYRDDVQRSIAFCGTDLEFFTRRKTEHLLDLVSRLLGEPERLAALDVGCSVGTMGSFLVGRFNALYGVDFSAEALKSAATSNPTVPYCASDALSLPFAGDSFDVVFAVCVVHHVAPPRRADLVSELRRVVRPGGLVVVFEHNAFNPLTRLAVSRCEFDDGVVLLTRQGVVRLLEGAGLQPVDGRYIIFSTVDRPIARRLDDALRSVPLGAQHYVVARR